MRGRDRGEVAVERKCVITAAVVVVVVVERSGRGVERRRRVWEGGRGSVCAT